MCCQILTDGPLTEILGNLPGRICAENMDMVWQLPPKLLQPPRPNAFIAALAPQAVIARELSSNYPSGCSYHNSRFAGRENLRAWLQAARLGISVHVRLATEFQRHRRQGSACSLSEIDGHDRVPDGRHHHLGQRQIPQGHRLYAS